MKANWEIGRHIIEFEQQGRIRNLPAGKAFKRFEAAIGRGFGRRNVLDMQRFYLPYQTW